MNKYSILVIAILALALFSGTVSATTANCEDHSENGLYTIIAGNVTDGSGTPIVNASVRVFCNHTTGNTYRINELTLPHLKTNKDGKFSVQSLNILPSRRCVKGDMAWFTVDYNGKTYTSEQVEVEKLKTTHRPIYHYYRADTSVSVPEFTTITLGVAIAGAMLGLVFLRKNN
jgi:hypothetical protein